MVQSQGVCFFYIDCFFSCFNLSKDFLREFDAVGNPGACYLISKRSVICVKDNNEKRF